ncbi:hypothetical protein LEN26_001373 [Aphanomyces euteiches]|nr:hypothetical protein AeMF1_010485 [Aphanomyces euteiches]KAH9161490.1 hypothetical protein LEN26_001373 [Aphanomyces euteiches]
MLGISIIFTAWVGTILLSQVALVAFILLPDSRPYILAFLAIYYGTRPLFPVQYSERVSKFYCWANSTPYFKRQEIVCEDDTPILPDSKVILSQHPHGILCCGWTTHVAIHSKWFHSRFHMLLAEILTQLPIVSNVLCWGGSESASKPNFEKCFKAGNNIAFMPGGFEEATLYEYGKHRIYIKKRAGFIKYGLQYGYKIYPSYHFGEEMTYHALTWFLPFRMWLNKFQLPGVLPFGSWWCFYMPLRSAELITVVGKPIQLPTIANPTREDVEKYHKIYIDAMQDLFDRHKVKYAKDPNAVLEIY